MFRFPKDKERKKLWLSRIRRDDFNFNENSRIGMKHFKSNMVLFEGWFVKLRKGI